VTTVEQGLPREGAAVAGRPRWIDVLALALGAIVLRIPALFAPTNLGYDDGGYGLAAVAMREGFEPFRDIFSSQGPLFLPLVHVADLVGFETMNAPRLLSVFAGAVVTVAVYFAGLELMDRGRALLAGALAGSSGILLWTTGPLTSDGTAAALATSTVAVALVYRRRPSTGLAIVITVLAGGAISVKHLLVGPALLVAWLLVLSARRVVDAVLVPVGAAVVFGLFAAPWGFADVYHDAIQYHLEKTGEGNRGGNLSKLVTTYLRRSTFLVVLGLVALVGGLWHRFGARRGPQGDPFAPRNEREPRLERLTGGTRILWWWAGFVLVVLLTQDPMFRNHLTALVAPFALLVARFRPSWRAVAITAIVTLPIQAWQLRPLLLPESYEGRAAVVVETLRALPEDAWALSDEPGFVWRAGKATDPFFVDPSVLRIDSPVPEIEITLDRLVEAAANPRQCAVVAWSPVRFGRFARLSDRLAALGYEQTEDFGRGRGIWVRPRCQPDRGDRASAGAGPGRSPG
jgi:4-amino-4-deoxy-L-arabinose transferase-like glycosyltransferase